MKQFLLSVLSLFVVTTLSVAQVTVTNAVFPAAGDVLSTAPSVDVSGISITAAGPNQTWDFSNVELQESLDLEFNAASSGQYASDFPSADLVTDLSNIGALAGIGFEGEAYMSITDGAIELVGVAVPDVLGFGFEVVTELDNPYRLYEAPLTYEQASMHDGNIGLQINWDELPAVLTDLVDSLNPLPITPDAIIISVDLARNDVVDAWGSLTTDFGTYDVLRQKQELTTDLKIEVSAFGFPIDVTDLIIDLIGQDVPTSGTTESYSFIAPNSKEPIALVNVTDGAVTGATFKSNMNTTAIEDVWTSASSLTAFPNPAVETVNISVDNVEAGTYNFRIYNILGSELWSEQHTIGTNAVVRANVSAFPKGTYLYSITDSEGNILATKRLLIVKP